MLRTIKTTQEIDALFRSADRVVTSHVIVLVASTPKTPGARGRVALIAGKKIGNAVFRNRARRVLREAVRQAGGPWDGFDVVLLARPATARSTPQRVAAPIRRALFSRGIGVR